MPLFEISGKKLAPVEQGNFTREKELQEIVEQNLHTIFNCRFIASEFSTGALHAGRIDTLALSEDNNPVIVEYKKIESSELITQSLFYLQWIQDHKGDFEIAAKKKLGNDLEVDWSDIRVICIAPNYRRYDLHAVQVMGANIELWQYRLFRNRSFHLEEVFQAMNVPLKKESADKSSVMVEAGKKAAKVRATASYSFEQHLEGKSKVVRELMYSIRDFIVELSPSIEEVPKKFYIAYKISQNIICMEAQSKSIKLYLKLKPDEISDPPENYRDVSGVGHFGTGDVEFTVRSEEELEKAKPFMEMAYNKLGG